MKERRRIKWWGNMAEIDGTVFVGSGWTPKRIERVLAGIPRLREQAREYKRGRR